jgi:hypothetical protein
LMQQELKKIITPNITPPKYNTPPGGPFRATKYNTPPLGAISSDQI